MKEIEEIEIEGIRETTREELEELEIEKINKKKEVEVELETIANITKEWSIIRKKKTFTIFFRCVNHLIKQAKEKKSLKNELK